MRRALLALSGSAALWPPALWAQALDKPWRIAFLAWGSMPRPGQFSTFAAIEAGLRERGYRALQTRAAYADARADVLPGLVQQQLAWQPDLIVTNLTSATLAAQRATRTVPIVMAGGGDPVATGLVQSLARPGGNVTGVSALGPVLLAPRVAAALDGSGLDVEPAGEFALKGLARPITVSRVVAPQTAP